MSGSPKEGKVPQGVSRKTFLIRGAAATAATLGAVALPGIRAEAAQHSPARETKRLEKFGNMEFYPVDVEGEPIEGSLETGPKGYWFPAKNGQVIETIVEELDNPSYIRSRLYSASGRPVSPERDTRTITTIMRSDNYFLVVEKRPDAPETSNRFRLRAREELEHGIQTTFRIRPGGHPYPEPQVDIRFPRELTPMLPDGDFEVVLDFNGELAVESNEGNFVTNPIIEVYGQKGGIEQVRGPRVSLPEDKPENRIQSVAFRYDGERAIVLPYSPDQNGGKIWPLKSHIAIVVGYKRNPRYWVARFFTLGVDK